MSGVYTIKIETIWIWDLILSNCFLYLNSLKRKKTKGIFTKE